MKSERSYKKITALALGLCLTISSVTVSSFGQSFVRYGRSTDQTHPGWIWQISHEK